MNHGGKRVGAGANKVPAELAKLQVYVGIPKNINDKFDRLIESLNDSEVTNSKSEFILAAITNYYGLY